MPGEAPAPGGDPPADRPGTVGATVWLTGLPASGKTTLALGLRERLRATGRTAVVLDGDDLRRGLCSDLGFSRADRAENARRATAVALLLAESGVVAVVALVSPFAADRADARDRHARRGLAFVEVWVNRPLADCERADPRGLYAHARAGALHGLTGVDGSYEAPRSPEVEIRPHAESVERSVERILARLSATSEPRAGRADPSRTRPGEDARPGPGGFGALRDAVLADPGAQARLRATRDWDGFVAAASALATERGITIERRDLEEARAMARRARLERGI